MNKKLSSDDIEFWLKVPIQEKDQVKKSGAWYFPDRFQWGVPKNLENSKKITLNKWKDVGPKPELSRLKLSQLGEQLTKHYLDDVKKYIPFNLEMNFKSHIPKFPKNIYEIDERLAGSFCEYIVNRVICERTGSDYTCENIHHNLYSHLSYTYYMSATYYRKQNDWSNAFKYYELSYKIDPNKLSLQWISHCYLNGLGVEKDIDLGNKLIHISDTKIEYEWDDEEDEEDNIHIENIKSEIIEQEQHLKQMKTAYTECNDITNKTIDIVPSILLMSLNHHYTFRQDTSKKDIMLRESVSNEQLTNFIKELYIMLPIIGLNKNDIEYHPFTCGGEDLIIKDTVIDHKLCNTPYRIKDIFQILLYASIKNCKQRSIIINKCEIWNFYEGKIYVIDLSWDLYSMREFLKFCRVDPTLYS